MKFCKKCGIKLDSDVAFCPNCGTPVSETKKSQREQDDAQNVYKTQVRAKPQTYGVLNLENLPEGHIIDDRYEIKEKLGQGGFGAVYRVYDKKMNIDKALKIIPEAIVSDEEAMADLQSEAQTMISLNHNNIVRVYDFHDSGAIKYIDMEYIEGKTLTKLKLEHPNKQIPEAKVKELAIKIADGLAYAHSKGIIHKDIKPQNVMVAKNNKVKIMDFGIAETVRSSMSRIQNSSSSGTLVYMSPEQIKGKGLGKESDIYSFGAMLYELLSGHPPFYKGDINYQILNEKPVTLDNVSDTMNEFVLKCLEKNYKDRYRSFEEVIKELGGKVKVYEKSPIIIEEHPKHKGKIEKLMSVVIRTKPEDASVGIDGDKIKTTTPVTIKHKTGIVSITIDKDGYKPVRENVEITKDGTNEFYLELESIRASITIESEIPGMQIYINEKDKGRKTPFTFEDLMPGKYEIELISENYYSEPKIVNLKEKGKITVKPDLIVYSRFKVLSSYKDISFHISNENINSSEDIKLKPGKYTIMPSFDYLPTIEIELKPEQKFELDYDTHIKKKTLTIKTGQYEVDTTITNNETGERQNQIFKGEKDISVLPGIHTILFNSKWKSSEVEINLISDNQNIDFGKEIDLAIKKHKKKIRRRIITIVSLLVLIIAGWLSYPTILENISWKEATSVHSLHSYQKYLDKYPNGKHKEKAFNLKNELIRKYLDYADIFFDKDKLSDAKSYYNSVLAIDPNNSKARDGLRKVKQKEDAIEKERQRKQQEEQAEKERLRKLQQKRMNSMVFVKGGTFQMGSNDGVNYDKPVHTVTVSDFYIGKYEVTQKEWKEVMGKNPSVWKVDNLPVERVSWYDAVEFCNKKSEKEGLTPCYTINKNRRDPNNKNRYDDLKWTVSCNFNANGYRLPTEAEWEYAARGGNKSKGYEYSGSSNIEAVAWYGDNSGSKTHSVGTKQANELGIYDMGGNVWEWCWDWYDEYYYRKSPSRDPKGADSGSYRVPRGGCWSSGDYCFPVALRQGLPPTHNNGTSGFRFVRTSK